MALALALRSTDIRVLLLEARGLPANTEDPRPLALSHGSRLILQRLGVWQRLPEATPITTIHISTGGGCSAVIEEVWVQPSARGAGLGSRLLRAAVAECRRRGIETIELRVSPADQEVGVPDFYTKVGFRHGGRLIYEFADNA